MAHSEAKRPKERMQNRSTQNKTRTNKQETHKHQLAMVSWSFDMVSESYGHCHGHMTWCQLRTP